MTKLYVMKQKFEQTYSGDAEFKEHIESVVSSSKIKE
jgi:hypothetical protein